MNIVQIHERIQRLLDEVATTRFESRDIDSFINGAIENIYRERYDRKRAINRSDAFQINQRVRDELTMFIKEDDTDNNLSLGTDKVLDLSGLTDYRYLLSIKITVGGIDYDLQPTTYDEKNALWKNPFRRARTGTRPKIYYNEQDNGIEIISEFTVAEIQKTTIDYLSDPIPVYFGDEYYDTFFPLPTGLMISIRDETVYSTVNYKIGEEFTSSAGSMAAGSGAVHSFVNPQLPESVHEELCRRSAYDMLVSIGKQAEGKLLLETIIAN